ncbi:MAG: IS1634 family transposase [Spirochaetota bacterium]
MSYIIEQKVKGHIYLYNVESYWDKEKRQPRQRRTYLGKKDAASGEVVKSPEIHDAREFGNIFLLKGIAEKIGLKEDLKEVFPETWQEILSLAYYRICENRALYLCDSWLKTIWSPDAVELTSPRISDLLVQIGHTQVFRERFFRKWAKRFADVNRFIVFDITSISSYAEGIDCIEWGYNRDSESLPQVNLGIVYGEPSGMPLYYSVYPGSIHDVTTLRNTITELKLLSLNKTLFILDKGFYSKANLRHMDGMKFIIPLPTRCSVEKEAVSSVQGTIRSSEYAIRYRDHVYHCVRKPITIGGETYTGHIFLNEHKQADSREAFLRRLLDAETLVGNQGFTQKIQMEDFLQDQLTDLVPYFNIKKLGTRYELARNSAAIDRHIGRLGIFVLMTNSDLSSETVISYYREKDGVEKCFDSLKNNLSFKRLRVHSNQNMEGLLFVEFIAMILRSKLNVVLRDSNLRDKMCIPEMLAEMRKLKEITFGKKKALSEMSKEQKLVFSAFGLSLEHAT